MNYTYIAYNSSAHLGVDNGQSPFSRPNYDIPDPHGLPLITYAFIQLNDSFSDQAKDSTNTKLDWLNPHTVSRYVQAIHCTFSVCAQRWTSQVESGRVIENVIRHQSSGNFVQESQPNSASPSDVFFHFDGNWSDALSADPIMAEAYAVNLILDDLVGFANPSNIYTTTGSYSTGGVPGPGGSGGALVPFVLRNFDNISYTFDRAALSVSLAMRSWSSTQIGGLLNGTAISTEAYFRARWPFLTVPLLFLFSSLIFVSLTAWQSHRSGLPLWKTNVLAAVVHAGRNVSRAGAGRLSRPSSLQEWAENERTAIPWGGLRDAG
ncbi:hypothetical protein H2200_011483 [Cladophialophora chaetospira]|uniref:Uncharacterized protein n=1 Tax=Cladophialophora chaetospira TaxID=386627 RepID=A0AA38WZE1_9EURO|nr:hypothetical protein H2200_011483 [Cladophialophora chaetospira]